MKASKVKFNNIIFRLTVIVDFIVPFAYLTLWLSFFKANTKANLLFIFICTVSYFYKIKNIKRIKNIKNKETFNILVNTNNFTITLSAFSSIYNENVFYLFFTMFFSVLCLYFYLNKIENN